MSPNSTNISWCDRTSNPLMAFVDGKRGWFCTKVSEGCQNCYAEKLNKRFGNRLSFTDANRERIQWRLNEKELAAILRRSTPTRIFLGDMGDLFHEDVPEDFLDVIWATMALTPQHTHLVLTKRPERMRDYLLAPNLRDRLEGLADEIEPSHHFHSHVYSEPVWPLPNVWLGVTAENQAMADERIPILLETPAAHRFVSCEPLLGPIKFDHRHTFGLMDIGMEKFKEGTFLDLVIAGGESRGPPERALVERCDGGGIPSLTGDSHVHWKRDLGLKSLREQCTGWRPKPQALEAVRSLRDQCAAAGVPFWWKQWGPRAGQGEQIDGRKWQEVPW